MTFAYTLKPTGETLITYQGKTQPSKVMMVKKVGIFVIVIQTHQFAMDLKCSTGWPMISLLFLMTLLIMY